MTLEKFVDITFKEGMKKNNQIKNDTYGNEYVVNNANGFCYKSI